MSDIIIKKVESKSDLMKFIKMQWYIYKGDAHWVPPLIMERKKILDKKKHPFYKHSEADFFLAEKDGIIVGRIAAIKNDIHNKYHNDKTGFFGFFECINDQTVADSLFDTAGKWLKEKGCDIMRGPANPSSNDEWGMLLEGFDDEPRILMTYNPKYYLDLCDNYGFYKSKDLVAYKLENEKVVASEKLKRVAEIARKRSGLTILELDKSNIESEIEKVKDVYNKSWAPNWGFVPMTNDELDAMADDLKTLAEPSLVLFGQIDGKNVGFALVMPDYNQIFKKMNGRLLPFNFLKLLSRKEMLATKWVRIIALGLIPEYQKKGLDAVFYWEIVNRAAALGKKLGEASWILEDNAMMNRGAKEVMNGEIYKKYRIYDKKL
jgi:hypothetical protein